MKETAEDIKDLRRLNKDCGDRVQWMKTDPSWSTSPQHLDNEYLLSNHDTFIRVSERNAETIRDLKGQPKRPWNDKYIAALEEHASCQEKLAKGYGKEILDRAKRARSG
jgi:hypothetical protein